MNTSKIDPVLGAKMGEVVSQTKNESDRKYDFHGPPLPLDDKVRRQRASIDGNILEAGLGRFQRLAKKQRVFQHIPKLIRGDLFIDGVDNQSIGSNSPPPNLLKLNSKCSPEEFRLNTVVENSYVPVQNHQAFGFLDAVVADDNLRYHTAGALGKGERIWMLAKLPDTIRVKNSDDITEKYLLLSNSHDGSSALRVYFTPIRVVCANTLAIAARNGRGQGTSIIQKGDLATKVRQAQEVLGLARKFYDDAEEQNQRLAHHYPSVRQLEEYFRQVYPDSQYGESSRTKNVRQVMLRLFEQGIGHDMPEIRHTTWTALNAVTEFVDHYRSTRRKSAMDRASNRLESARFGSGARLKARAWELAVKMAA